MNTIFYWHYVCHVSGYVGADLFDAWCSGPRSMDCCTEQALNA